MVNETSKIEVCQLNDEELCNIVKLVMSVVDSFDNFKEVEDPLPKFSCDTMSLDIGERRVEIIKQIQQSDLVHPGRRPRQRHVGNQSNISPWTI